jgi:hypothetical protein
MKRSLSGVGRRPEENSELRCIKASDFIGDAEEANLNATGSASGQRMSAYVSCNL